MTPRYVWLDRLSVPQDDQPLKFTLLARMMAVYTAAKATLALRTIEDSGSRYHERVWTCQEFVVARRLVIATQEPGPGDTRSARSPECDKRMAALRKRIQMQRFVPLWLRANSGKSAVGKVTEISRADGEFILGEFYSLSNYLSCTVAGDRLRALLPLVSCAPLEDHQELVSLVLAISKATGKDLLDWKESLLKQHQKEKRIMQKTSMRKLCTTAAICMPWWGCDSLTTEDDALAGVDTEASSMSVDDPWPVWKPQSSFRARVIGVVSQESVLEDCNRLRMRSSKSVTGATTAFSGQELMSMYHSKTKKKNSIKRKGSRTTISNFSEASTSRGSSRSNTFTGKSSSPLSNTTPASLSDAIDQGLQRRAPLKTKSLLSNFPRTRSPHPEDATPDAPERRPPVKPSGTDDGQADQGARQLRTPSTMAPSSSTGSAPPEEPTSDNPQTLLLAKQAQQVSFAPAAVLEPSPSGHADGDDQAADQEARKARRSPTRRGSLLSGLASALSFSSPHPDGSSSADNLQRQLLARRVSIADALLEHDDDAETDQRAPLKRDSFFALLASAFSIGEADDEESALENTQSDPSNARRSRSRFSLLPKSLPSGNDDGETDQEACQVPSKRNSFFSSIASAFSVGSSHHDESAPEVMQPNASAQDAPEASEPLSGSDAIGAASMDTTGMKAGSNGNVHMLAAAAAASPCDTNARH